MNPRAQARAVLEEARAILAARLAEQVLDAAEAILDDARGDSYMSEIDEVYDRIGLKLVHVGQMLNHFPHEVEESPVAEPAASEPAENPAETPAAGPILLRREALPESSTALSSRTIILPQLLRPRLALPQPSARQRAATDTLTLLALLAAQVHAGELTEATTTVAEMLTLDAPRATTCVGVYHRRQALDPEFVAGSMMLVPAIESGRMDDAVPLLSYCFGLDAPEAVAAYHRLRAKQAAAA